VACRHDRLRGLHLYKIQPSVRRGALMPPAVECRGVSKMFALRTRSPLLKDRVLGAVRPHLRDTRRSFWALRDVDLVVEPGDIRPHRSNGAGKTTLLRGCWHLSAYGGTKSLCGAAWLHCWRRHRLSRRLTGRENIYLAAALLGFNTRQIRTVEDAIIEFSELGGLSTRQPDLLRGHADASRILRSGATHSGYLFAR
jgi:ABC-type polysaccharide/polyol phosphate transport system ATPase subunit